MKKIKNKKGITLIALVVTIVIILILAGITVGMVTSDNGILKETKSAKTQAEIDNEKSIVERAKMLTMMRDKSGKVTFEVFEPALKDEAGANSTEVSDAGDIIEVLFTDSNRYYEVDKDGNVSESQEVVKDEYAGDITKGGRCDGSEEKPYEISCIEDLVVLSNMTSGTGIQLKNGQAEEITGANTFEGKNIILIRNLNFKSKYSYADSIRTDFGNLNGDDTDGNKLITEMTTGTGWIPIGNYTRRFGGSFSGKGYTIANMHINAAADDKTSKGLFGELGGNAIIKELTITGEIKANWHSGGIAGEGRRFLNSNCTISNCINKVNIVGYNMVGGIAGFYINNIENCKNYGTIEITGSDYGYAGVGGIIGTIGADGETITIKECENYGEVKGTERMGGIVGNSGGNTLIMNCKNFGKINAKDVSAGGILGVQNNRTIHIINSYNTGDVLGQVRSGGIIGNVEGSSWDSILDTYIYNCYNIGKIESNYRAGGIVGGQGTVCAKNYLTIENSYGIGTVKGKEFGAILGSIVNSSSTETKTDFKNVYYPTEPSVGMGSLTSGETTLKSISEIKSQSFVDLLNSNIGTNTDWKQWKIGNNGYPVFTN